MFPCTFCSHMVPIIKVGLLTRNYSTNIFKLWSFCLSIDVSSIYVVQGCCVELWSPVCLQFHTLPEEKLWYSLALLAEEEVNSSRVGWGDGAKAAAFLGIGPADMARHKMEEIRNTSWRKLLLVLFTAAGGSKQFLWLWVSYAGASHVSALPV